ncbi:hypothetical protein BD410DRAFT_786321 [Rickenella mellea]|uniref:MYND-type domain-containing protein n=1 Tax=Rickenella mellea TaxID=50990 RepID=A0A4Y7QBL2_9AGAM|nr:hypothetical protein BD410DRAFT_786321 [Rickenella mellea]
MPTTPALKCPPQLPRKLLRELSRNPVVTGGPLAYAQCEIDELRYKVAIRALPVDHSWPIQGTTFHSTLLQIGASTGDLTLAYEMIRLGANVDAIDYRGRTPLLHAIQYLVAADVKTEGRLLQPESNDPYGFQNAGPRMKMVATLLIEQRADVNFIWNDSTCLTILLRSKFKHWDIIGLLMAHGAREGVGPESRNVFVLLREEKERLSELLRTRPSKRPPRPCPCFSGHLLSDCHGKETRPFPYYFLCPCKSGLVYANCCKKRKVSWWDMWNEERGIIETWRKDLPVYLPLPHDTITILLRLRDERLTPSPSSENFRRPTDVPLAVAQTGIPPEMADADILKSCLDAFLRSGSVDPAFAFAMKKVRWNARPLGRKLPKTYAVDLAQAFNEYVDDYVASGQDFRQKMEIEIAAKLGSSCGALYRVCEANGCNEQEGRSLKQLKYCRECRMAVYCSVTCQRAHWPIHKNVCCSTSQTEQPLPSQRVLQEKLSQMVVATFSASIEQIKDSEPERFLELFPNGLFE